MFHRNDRADLSTSDCNAIRSAAPWWPRLTPEEIERLSKLTARFLATKRFEGAQGFTPTREMQVVIAAHASLLVLGLDLEWYRDVSSVIVAPHIQTRRGPRHLDGGVVDDGDVRLSGEALLHGPVLITWDTVRNDVIHPERGHNVVFHEFAHKIDMASGAATGQPLLAPRLAERWQHVMSDLLADLRTGKAPALDDYGATNPAELLAVCTEAFMTTPRRLQRAYPDLYDLLATFYRQDPAARVVDE